MKYLMVPLVVAAGAGIPLQLAMNKRMSESVSSPALAVMIAFVVGALALVALTLSGVMGRAEVAGVRGAPWWAFAGGLFSAFAVVVSVVGVKQGGAGAIVAATIFGQLVAAMALDHFGWLGVERAPVNFSRVAGAALLCVGALLMQRK